MQNDQGQGVSHATGESKVPQKVQEKVPAGFEKGLPDSVCLIFSFSHSPYQISSKSDNAVPLLGFVLC
jgi:hypothetical protein